MPSYAQENKFFLNEFDESLDGIYLDVVEATARAARSTHKSGRGLDFYINSEGGDATRAFALVELIEVAKAKNVRINTYVLSECHSAGSIVAVAGTKGHRYTSRGASYLLHFGETESISRSPLSATRILEENIRHFERVLAHYVANGKATKEEWLEEFRDDNFYLSGAQAIRWGLADKYLV